MKVQWRTGIRSRMTVAATVLVVAASLAACSSSGGSKAASDNPSLTGTPIKVGVIDTLSGPASADSASGADVSKAWAAWVNKNGGLRGHPVEVIIKDDQGSTPLSAKALNELINVDKVVAIVGNNAQGGGEATWAPILEKAGIPLIGGLGANTNALTSPMYFSTSANLLALFYGTAQTAATYGNKMSQLYCAGTAVCATTVDLLKTMGGPLGVQVAYSSAVDGALPDYTAICQGIKNSGSASFSTSLASNVNTRFAAQCATQGLTIPMLSQTANQEMAGLPGFSNVSFIDSRFPFFDESTPATKEFHEALREFAPKIGTKDEPLNFLDPAIWVSGKLFEAAVNASPQGDVTTDSIKQGLYALKGETLGGLTGPLTFTPGKVTLNNCYFNYVLKDGKFSVPGGTPKPVCAPADVIDKIVGALLKK